MDTDPRKQNTRVDGAEVKEIDVAVVNPINSRYTVKRVRKSDEKVDRVVFHPCHPMVAYADRGGGVCVWNYESNEVCIVMYSIFGIVCASASAAFAAAVW